MGDGDGIDIIPGEMGRVKSLIDGGEDGFEMRAGGNLGNDATVGSENIDLGEDDTTKNMDAVFDDGDGGFITRRLDGEDFHRGIIAYLFDFLRK